MRYNCKLCKSFFLKEKNFAIHMKIIHEEEMFPSGLCRIRLQYCESRRTISKPKECRFCKREFQGKYKCNRHERVCTVFKKNLKVTNDTSNPNPTQLPEIDVDCFNQIVQENQEKTPMKDNSVCLNLDSLDLSQLEFLNLSAEKSESDRVIQTKTLCMRKTEEESNQSEELSPQIELTKRLAIESSTSTSLTIAVNCRRTETTLFKSNKISIDRYKKVNETSNTAQGQMIGTSSEKKNCSIPQLMVYFNRFDPVNVVGSFCLWSNYKYPNDVEFNHVYNFLISSEFSRTLLHTTEKDCIVHAVVSYLLRWTDEGLVYFGEQFPEFEPLVGTIISEKARNNVYSTEDGIPFVRSSFKILWQYFKKVDAIVNKALGIKSEESQLFRINDYVPESLVSHFEEVYQWLVTDCMTQKEIDILESKQDSPFLTTATNYIGFGSIAKYHIKIITGQECSGKSTLLDILKVYGWNVCSRVDLGSFSRKSRQSQPISVGYQAATMNALNRGDVVGEQGIINSQLWPIISTLCDPQYKDRVVQELMQFFNGTLNEHVVTYMFCQQVIVLVDPYPSQNRQRMLQQYDSGSAYRARIFMYPIVQCIAYYMAARLYNWTIRCVPYNDHRELQSQRYLSMAEEIITLFGEPTGQQPMRVASEPDGKFLEDTEYSVTTGLVEYPAM